MAGNAHADEEAREAAVMKPGVGGVLCDNGLFGRGFG
jgi:hypothetical protein